MRHTIVGRTREWWTAAEPSIRAPTHRPQEKGSAMPAALVENDQVSAGHPWDCLLQTWRELDVPEGGAPRG
ncbi:MULTISPECIES: hypothetical protein [unclassified Streptomyces]|uniref:hypothetical protein n=1 Tax=unclassified Streptomyces TaxID=2593676 RepID=UPI0036E8BDC8